MALDKITTGLIADDAITSDQLGVGAIAGSDLASGVIEVIPHIKLGTLQPAVAGKLLDGTTNHGSTYGVAQGDGFSYYYTDIKGSKPIKDPRIGSHFGCSRHITSCVQKLEQETATHGSPVYSVDGRSWMRMANQAHTTSQAGNDGNGRYIRMMDTLGTMEITGYFSDLNIQVLTAANRTVRYALDGASEVSTNYGTVVSDTPLWDRFVNANSSINIPINTTLGIHTVKIRRSGSAVTQIGSIELIAQDTTSTATKSKVQIPSQEVVSFGKKFTVAAAAHHYDPFNGFTNSSGNAAGLHSTYVDTATSLGLSTGTLHGATWAISGTNNIRPYNGGRVVKWVDSAGVIKTSVNMIPPNAQNITTTAAAEITTPSATNTYLPAFSDDAVDHSLSEVAKTFHYREFGNGSANGNATWKDLSFIPSTGSTQVNVSYVMDDGLTSCVGYGSHPTGTPPNITSGATGRGFYFTFIGTGLSLKNTISTGTWSTLGARTIVANLPYGTHVYKHYRESSTSVVGTIDGVSLGSVSTGSYSAWEEVDFHQPKMPPIPEDALIISDYMLMADFVPDTVGNTTTISKGVRRNNNSRDLFYSETDNGAVTLVISETSPAGFSAYLSNGADSATSFKVRLPSFGTNFVHRGHAVAARSDQYIADSIQTSTDGSATSTTSAHYLASNQTLGVYNWGHNAKSGQAGNVEAYDIASPIHSSSHYQSFETPFLKELVGGDRNMEQTNLVVTPDGKTWDEVTRDTSYIGNMVLNINANSGSVATVVIFDEILGTATESGNAITHFYKDFAIAYDRQICLVDGQYVISYSTQTAAGLDRVEIFVNSLKLWNGYTNDTSKWDTLAGSVNVYLKRGDYVQIFGGYYQDDNNFYTTYHIDRV